jgi:hypothetical protein
VITTCTLPHFTVAENPWLQMSIMNIIPPTKKQFIHSCRRSTKPPRQPTKKVFGGPVLPFFSGQPSKLVFLLFSVFIFLSFSLSIATAFWDSTNNGSKRDQVK